MFKYSVSFSILALTAVACTKTEGDQSAPTASASAVTTTTVAMGGVGGPVATMLRAVAACATPDKEPEESSCPALAAWNKHNATPGALDAELLPLASDANSTVRDTALDALTANQAPAITDAAIAEKAIAAATAMKSEFASNGRFGELLARIDLEKTGTLSKIEPLVKGAPDSLFAAAYYRSAVTKNLSSPGMKSMLLAAVKGSDDRSAQAASYGIRSLSSERCDMWLEGLSGAAEGAPAASAANIAIFKCKQYYPQALKHIATPRKLTTASTTVYAQALGNLCKEIKGADKAKATAIAASFFKSATDDNGRSTLLRPVADCDLAVAKTLAKPYEKTTNQYLSTSVKQVMSRK